MKRFFVLLIAAVIIFSASCGASEVRVGAGRTEIDLPASESAPQDEVSRAESDGPTDTEPPFPEENDYVSIVMVGDVLLHEPITESGLQEDGSYNFDHLFANVKEKVAAADLALVNEEVILGGTELGLSGYPRFNGPFEVADAEAAAGFDVILQATNHALDKDKAGLINDIEYYRSHFPELSVTGIYDSEEARNTICVRDVKGIKIAVLNYTYSTNGRDMPAGMPWAVAMLDEDEVRADFDKAREAADFIIVCPHWGTEYSHEVSGYQRSWAEYFAELGADLVLGAHPHVIEPVEEIERPDGTMMPVFWSVGNFVHSTGETGSGVANRMVGAMASVTLKISDDGSVRVDSYEAIPLVTQMAFGRGAPTTYFLSDYTEELAARNKVIERDPAFSIEFVRELCRNVLGGAWKDVRP